MTATNQNQTILGRSVVLRGELSGNEDLLIEGQFEGTITLQENCVTVGPHGQVKAEIHARHVIVQGSVNGNITAGEKIEVRRSGQAVGDLVAAGIAIEDGAYFKGSIDILREQDQEAPRSLSAPNALKTSA
jgi:cytoskeletal protein CcmA (bactofilin family)